MSPSVVTPCVRLVVLSACLSCDGGVDRGVDGAPDGAIVPADAGVLPEPIPVIDNEPPAPCTAMQPAGYYQFLDDTCRVKRMPAHADREQACPIVDFDAAGYRPGTAPIVVEDVLADIVPAGIDVAVIEIRRVDGVPYYRYLSNGGAERVVQPWSTTKWIAAANAGASLRRASGGTVGLTASVDGYPLGDLVTSIANYDGSPYTSNALGRYFHDIGGRVFANDLIHASWLGRPANETFGGNYGEPAPALGLTFVEPGGATVTVARDESPPPKNRLSMLTLAEALKRTVLFREDPGQRMPDLTWPDVQALLYGAAGSARYGDWGGLAADTAIYMQSAHDWEYIARRSRGRWRIFSKLGFGDNGELVNVAYACLPVLDGNDQPVPGWGREIVIAAHTDTGSSDYAVRDRALARAFRSILVRVVDGRL